MADIRKDTRFLDFLAYKKMSVAEFESADASIQAQLAAEIEEWKINNPIENKEKEDKYSIEDAVNIATNGNLNMMPEDLVVLNDVLKDAANIDDDAKKAYNNVQRAIGIKTSQYAAGEIDVDIDDADSLLALIDSYIIATERESTLDYETQDRTRTVKDVAKDRLSAFLAQYDEENGLTGLDEKSADFLNSNSTVLEGIGDENLLETTIFIEQAVVPMEFEQAQKIIADRSFAKIDIKEFAALQASMDRYAGSFSKEANYIVSKAARDKVLEVVEKKKSLGKEDLASFDFVLGKVEAAAEKNTKLITPKNLEKAKKSLSEARNIVANTIFTKDPEMQEAYNLLSAIRVSGKLKRFNRETIEQRNANGDFLPDSEMGLFIESIKEQTKRQMLSSKEPITPEVFKSNFTDNLQIAIFEIANIERIAKGQTKHSDAKKLYNNFVDLSQDGKKISINQETFAGYAAGKNKESNSFLKRLEKKVGNIQAVKAGRKSHDNLDIKNEKTHGDKYKGAKNFFRVLGKTALKASAMAAAFGAASTIGAPAVAAIATVSFGTQVWKLRKEFKNQKMEAAKNGYKLTFGKFMKKNPDKGIGLALGFVGAAIPGIGATVGTVSAAMAPYMTNYIVGSAIAGASVASAKPFVKMVKNPSRENIWGFATVLASSAVGFAVGRAGAQVITPMAYDYFNSGDSTYVPVTTLQAAPLEADLTNLSDPNTGFNYYDPANKVFNFTPLDANNNGIPDYMEGSKLAEMLYPESTKTVDITTDANNNLPNSLEVNEKPVEQTLETKTEQQATPKEVPTQSPRDQVLSNQEQQQKVASISTENVEKVQETKTSSIEKGPEIAKFEANEVRGVEIEVPTDKELAMQDFETREAMNNLKTHLMTDSINQSVEYQIDANGNVKFTNIPEGWTGHSEMADDITKSIMERVENGTATAGDLKALASYNKDSDLLAAAQEKYDAVKAEFIQGKEAQYAETRAVETSTKTENLAENLTKETKEAETETVTASTTEKETTVEIKAVSNETAVSAQAAKVTLSAEGNMSISKGDWQGTLTQEPNGALRVRLDGIIDLPPEVQQEMQVKHTAGGMFKIGPTEATTIEFARTESAKIVNELAGGVEVCNQLEAKEESGMNLTSAEKNYIKTIESRLANYGFQRADDGHMQPIGADKSIALEKTYAKPETTITDNKVVETTSNTTETTKTVAAVENDQMQTSETTKESEYKISKNGTLTYINNSSPEVSVPADVKALANQVYVLEDGRFRVGDTIHKNPEIALQKASIDLNNLYKNNDAYNDLITKQEQGGELSKGEAKFIANHEKKMDAFNLTNKDGQIAVSEKYNPQLLSNNNQKAAPEKTGPNFGIQARRHGIMEAESTLAGVDEAYRIIKGIGGIFK